MAKKFATVRNVAPQARNSLALKQENKKTDVERIDVGFSLAKIYRKPALSGLALRFAYFGKRIRAFSWKETFFVSPLILYSISSVFFVL